MSSNPQSLLRGVRKEVRPFLRNILDRGGKVTLTKANHVRVILGDEMIFIALTPSGGASITGDMVRLRKLLERAA